MIYQVVLFFIFLNIILAIYDREKSVQYTYKYYNFINHLCGSSGKSCTPYPYYGSNFCSYTSTDGQEDFNFISQCLREAGHPK